MVRRSVLLVGLAVTACGRLDSAEPTSHRGEGDATAIPDGAPSPAAEPSSPSPPIDPGAVPVPPDSAFKRAHAAWRGLYRVDHYVDNAAGCEPTGLELTLPYPYFALDWADPGSPFGDLMPFPCADAHSCATTGLADWRLVDPENPGGSSFPIQAANVVPTAGTAAACVAPVAATDGELTGAALVLKAQVFDDVVAATSQADCSSHRFADGQAKTLRARAAAGQLPCDHATSLLATRAADPPAAVDANPDRREITGVQGAVQSLTDPATSQACAQSQVGVAPGVIGRLFKDAHGALALCRYASATGRPVLATNVLPELTSMPGYAFKYGYLLYVMADGRSEDLRIALGTQPGGAFGDALLVTSASQADGNVAVRRVTVPKGTAAAAADGMLGEAACAQVTDSLCVFLPDFAAAPERVTVVLSGGRRVDVTLVPVN